MQALQLCVRVLETVAAKLLHMKHASFNHRTVKRGVEPTKQDRDKFREIMHEYRGRFPVLGSMLRLVPISPDQTLHNSRPEIAPTSEGS